MNCRPVGFSGVFARILFACMVSIFSASAFADTCSGYIGQATINEVFKQSEGSNADAFIEIRILDPDITATQYGDWTLEACTGSGCSGPVDVAQMEDSYPWIVADNTLISGDFIDLGTQGNQQNRGMDITLRDGSGNLIDYLTVGAFQRSSSLPGCTLPYDQEAPSSNTKNLVRLPDGTGEWTLDPGGSGDRSPGESNDGNPAFPGPASLVIEAPSQASVCQPLSVTIRAVNADGSTAGSYQGTVDLSASSNHGRWGINEADGSLNPDPDSSDDGEVSYQFVEGDNGEVHLWFSNTHADVLTLSAIDGQNGINATTTPITFAENALFIESTDPLGDDLIAGRSHRYQVSMLRQDPDSGECGVASDYDGTFGVKAWLERTADDPGGQAPQVASAEDSVTPPDTAPANNNLAIGFDGGVASLVLTPGDVGRYTLNLRDDSSGFVQDIDGNPLPVGSASAAAPWTARPFALGLEVTDNPGAQDASGPVFLAAGEDFSLRVGGALYDGADDANGDGVADEGANLMDNGFAPSFGQEGEQVSLTAGLLAPSTGDNPGLAGPQPQAGDFSGGLAAVDGYRFTEVGIIDLAAVIGDGNYLAAGNDRTARMDGSSGPVGRFVPDHFTAEANDDGTLDMACNGTAGFTYSGQDMAWAVTPEIQVTARNTAGAETRNYLIGDFMRLLPEGVARAWPSADETALLADDTTPYPVTVADETGEIAPRGDGDPIVYRYAADDVIRYTKSAEATVAPFAPALTFEVEDIVDQDDVAALTSGTGRVPLALEPDANGDIHYGRRVLENVYGPETADELRMPFYMEYWTGSGFAVNDNDSCTDWIADADLQDPEQYHGLASRGDSGTFDAGVAEPLVLEPAGDPGEDLLSWSGLPVWQQHDWDGDGNLEGPSATATFGVYRGHDRIIYWREVND